MKKRNLAVVIAILFLVTGGITSYAADNATVSFTGNNTLEYSGVTVGNGNVDLGDAFEGVAPGEARSQTITVKNDNGRTADFYMSAEAVKALEVDKAAAKGAGYEISLKAGDMVLYDSGVGGYNEAKSASTSGIDAMNHALEDWILIGTLKQGESMDVVMTICFDGEAMDNTDTVDYSFTSGQLAFDFQVGYEDPSGAAVIVREVKEDGTVTYVRKVVEIIENAVPLGAVATGDGAMIGAAVAVLFVGLGLVVFGKKKNSEEKA